MEVLGFKLSKKIFTRFENARGKGKKRAFRACSDTPELCGNVRRATQNGQKKRNATKTKLRTPGRGAAKT